MKIFSAFAIVLATLILCARSASGAYGLPSDFVVESTDKDGNFYCDGLTCPKKTTTCDVSVKNDPNNPQMIIRELKCLSVEGKVLDRLVSEEPAKPDPNSQTKGAPDLGLKPLENMARSVFEGLSGIFG